MQTFTQFSRFIKLILLALLIYTLVGTASIASAQNPYDYGIPCWTYSGTVQTTDGADLVITGEMAGESKAEALSFILEELANHGNILDVTLTES